MVVELLDFASGLTIQGFTIPAITSRKVRTEVELSPGQSFAIGGLLEKQLTNTVNKIPGLGDIPLIGKLFQSRNYTRENTELLVIVTPQLVQPIPAGQPAPALHFPREFMEDENEGHVANPTTNASTAGTPQESIPIEKLVDSMKTPELNLQQGQPTTGGMLNAPQSQPLSSSSPSPSPPK